MGTVDLVIVGVVALAAIVAVLLLAYWLKKLSDQLQNARDLVDAQRKATEDTERDRDSYKAQVDALTARNKDLLDRISVAESERNAAYARARDHVVEQIKSSNVADAAKLVNDLLARPLPGVLPSLPDVRDAAGQAAGDGAGSPGAVPPAGAAPPAR